LSEIAKKGRREGTVCRLNGDMRDGAVNEEKGSQREDYKDCARDEILESLA